MSENEGESNPASKRCQPFSTSLQLHGETGGGIRVSTSHRKSGCVGGEGEGCRKSEKESLCVRMRMKRYKNREMDWRNTLAEEKKSLKGKDQKESTRLEKSGVVITRTKAGEEGERGSQSVGGESGIWVRLTALTLSFHTHVSLFYSYTTPTK